MMTAIKRRALVALLLALYVVISTLGLTGRAAAQSSTSLIDGFVFADVNGNDVPDPGIDPGLSGVTLTLRDTNGAAVATTLTAANGEFDFSNVPMGVYLVTESAPPGYYGIDVTPGTAASTVDLTTVRVNVAGLDTYAGTVFLNRQQATPPAGPNVIKGFVFDDANGNGQRDPGESWVNGVLVTLQDASRNSIAQRGTVGFGQFAFSELPNGTYTLVVTAPAGLVATSAVAGTGGVVVDARTIRVTTMGGTVSYDGQVFLLQVGQGNPTPVPVPPVGTPPSTQPGPSLTLTVDKQVVAPGDTLTYTLTVAAGATSVSRGELFAVVPPGAQFVVAGQSGMLWGDTVVWTFGPLAAGASGYVAFQVRVPGSAIPGTAIQEQTQLVVGSPAVAISSKSVSSTVAVPGVPVTLLTTVDRTAARPGEVVTYRLTYTNVSGTVLGNVQIVDPVPAGLLFLGADANVQVDVATRTLRFLRGDLAPGATGTITIQTRVPADQAAGSVFTNQARVEAPGLPQPIVGNAVTVAVQLVSFAGTYKLIQDPANPTVNVANPTSITVDAGDHFTVITIPADQPAPSCLDAQGTLNPDGSFDVTTANGLARFTGRIDTASGTAALTVQRTGYAAYPVTLPRVADLNSGGPVGTFTGFATNTAGDALRVRLTLDGLGNATFEADLIQLFPTRTRCLAGAYQVTTNGQLSFGGRLPDGQLQGSAGGSLTLTYNYADMQDGYHSTFQVPLIQR